MLADARTIATVRKIATRVGVGTSTDALYVLRTDSRSQQLTLDHCHQINMRTGKTAALDNLLRKLAGDLRPDLKSVQRDTGTYRRPQLAGLDANTNERTHGCRHNTCDCALPTAVDRRPHGRISIGKQHRHTIRGEHSDNCRWVVTVSPDRIGLTLFSRLTGADHLRRMNLSYKTECFKIKTTGPGNSAMVLSDRSRFIPPLCTDI